MEGTDTNSVSVTIADESSYIESQKASVLPIYFHIASNISQTHKDYIRKATVELVDPENQSEVNSQDIIWKNTDKFKMNVILNIYIPPILIIIGTIGNILSLIVFRRKDMKKQSICFYMAAYCIANILVLFMGSGLMWISIILNVQYIANLSDWGCRLWQFFINVVMYSEVWLVVAMGIDRFIIIWHPKKAHSMCSVFKAKLAIVMILIGLIVISVHAMWMYELLPNGCYIPHLPEDLHAKIWPWVTASFYSFIPLFVLLVLDVSLLLGICVRWQLMKSQDHRDVSHDLTNATVVLTILYFIFFAPAQIINVVNINHPTSWLQNPDLMACLELAREICQLLTFLNPTIPIAVYLICSAAFRGEFIKLFQALFQCIYKPNIYEMNLTSSSAHTDLENCSETTPL